MRRTALLIGLLVVLAAACSGDDEAVTPTAPTAPTVPTVPTETGDATVTTAPPPSVAPRPGATLDRFVRAARGGDDATMWRLLSSQTRERFGPTLAEFRAGTARRLATTVGSFVRGRSNLFLDQQVNDEFAVAAFGGLRIANGRTARGAYAAALRFENDVWRLELGGPVVLEALVPDPGEVENRDVQVAAGAEADAAILEGGLWLDGRAVPGESGGTDERRLTFYSEAVEGLAQGPHAAVAFASTSEDAAALAWLFTVR